MIAMRRPWLLATTLLTHVALLAPAALAQPVVAAAATPGEAIVRVRTGQHDDRGRVVLHLGKIPSYSLRKTDAGFELRLSGAYRLDLSTTRRLTQLAGLETRQEGNETVLLLRGDGDRVAEAAAFDGMLYVDLRAGPASGPPAPVTLEAAQRKILDDAVRLGLMKPAQAVAKLQAARPGVSPPVPVSAPVTAPVPVPRHAPAPIAVAAPELPVAVARPLPPANELAGLREAVIAKLAVLNGLQPGAALPPVPPQASRMPVSAAAPPAVPVPAAAPPIIAAAPVLPSCGPPASMQGWKGDRSFTDALPVLRAALARSDQGAAEAADLAEFYLGHELAREALDVLDAPRTDAPIGALRDRLDRVRDVARLLLGRPLSPASPLLAEATDCTREDLPLWRSLAAAASGDGATLAQLAPRARAALRDVPQELRLALVQRLADAVDKDPATLRTLLGAIRPATGLSAIQAAARNWQYSRLARQEGNRSDEAQYLDQAAQAGGRSLPEIFARARIAALNLAKPGAEGRRAEAQVNDLLRTYRHDALGEEAAIVYAQRLLDQGALGAALAVADGASQATARPGTESRGARLAAAALRRLLADAPPDGQTLPEPGERLGLFWQYEGYATPGERGDDIRLAAMRLLLKQGLAEAARDLGQQITPATAGDPAVTLLLAQAEASAAQGDPQRALALVRILPVTDSSRRVSADALARLGKLQDAAAQLEPLVQTADLSRRAELLFQARSWGAAGSAYGNLLRDPALPAAAREDATARLASASVLAQQKGGVPQELLSTEASSTAMLKLAENAPPATIGIAGVRAAIERSREIEALLPPERRP
jgi:hypothetical protein